VPEYENEDMLDRGEISSSLIRPGSWTTISVLYVRQCDGMVDVEPARLDLDVVDEVLDALRRRRGPRFPYVKPEQYVAYDMNLIEVILVRCLMPNKHTR
jgi:hypothetical protein